MFFLFNFFMSIIMAIASFFGMGAQLDHAKVELPCDISNGYEWTCVIADENVAKLCDVTVKNGKQIFNIEPGNLDYEDAFPTIATFTSTRGETVEYAFEINLKYESSLTLYAPDEFMKSPYTAVAKNPIEGAVWTFSEIDDRDRKSIKYTPVTENGECTFEFFSLKNWTPKEATYCRDIALSYGIPGKSGLETQIISIAYGSDGSVKIYDESKIFKIQFPVNDSFFSGAFSWDLGRIASYSDTGVINEFTPVQDENFDWIDLNDNKVINTRGTYYLIDGWFYSENKDIPSGSKTEIYSFLPEGEGITRVTFYKYTLAYRPGVTPSQYITFVFTVDSEMNMTVTVDPALSTVTAP